MINSRRANNTLIAPVSIQAPSLFDVFLDIFKRYRVGIEVENKEQRPKESV